MKNFAKKFPLIFGVVAFFIMFGGIKLIHAEGTMQGALLRFVLSALMILAMWPALGSRWMKFPGKGWKESFGFCKWIFIITAAFVVIIAAMGVIGKFVTGSSDSVLAENWMIVLIESAVSFISVGIIEELGVRRAIFDSGMQQFPKMKNKALCWGIISAFVFGFMHVVTDLSADPTTIAAAAIKTLESGMFGLVMSAVVIEGENIWAVAAVHAFNDLIPGVLMIFDGDSSLGGYAQHSENFIDWLGANWSMILFIVIYIPFVIKAVKVLKKHDAAETLG